VEYPDGIPHRPNHGKQLPVDVLLARREVFPAVVPDGVALLTAGVDTQDDRFEITITGWGGTRNRGQSRMTLFMAIWKRKNRGSDSMRT
jgi:phage terminase large subunit GpA-like protein